MADRKTNLIAIGGGEMSEAREILDEILGHIGTKRDPRLAVLTVATNESEAASVKYNGLFRRLGIRHVDIVNVSQREDSFAESSIKKIKNADALFFTGGDQLNITSLLGGTPLHNLIYERYKEGVLIAGTSAGAAMMSSSMIISGNSDSPPKVSGVTIAPGMDLVETTIIDTHFSQRGRHGRLLTAIAHYPQVLGLGIDERTAMVVNDGEFKVIGEGVVTVFDGRNMHYSDLPYRKEDETVGMFGVDIHVLPSGYRYNMKEREPLAPRLTKMAGADDDV
ncbi:MAG TPA: cyanophycinase [Pyrinomonadaceae bacterium]|nr:cyanophycinase [Pyrinomonadaceae bacterium]